MASLQSNSVQSLADLAPKFVQLTNEVVFGDVWERPGLSQRDRSLITVTALTSLYRTEQLGFHLRKAIENGLSAEELAEAITHLAFYTGWPNAVTALTQLKAIVDESGAASGEMSVEESGDESDAWAHARDSAAR